jgi:hypothetical protein
MRMVNAVIGAIVDAMLWPFQSWPPLAGLTVVSLLVAAALLVAFKLTSNQHAIASTRRRIQAGLYELRLFQDDPRLMPPIVFDLFREHATYLRYALVPLLWVAIPLTLLIAHLQAYYGYDGLHPGQTAVVTARLRPGAEVIGEPQLTLDAPPGLRVETPSVWVPSRREASWRIAADREGDYDLRIIVNGHAATKRVRVTSRIVARSPVRQTGSVWTAWEYPAEAPLPADSPIEAITISYPEATIATMPWLIVFLLLTTLFALAGRPFAGVVW